MALGKVPQRQLAEPLEHGYDKGKVFAWLREHGHGTADILPGGGFV
ncbi:hypothetical protein O1Q96_01510 (plasmid) [Streptomyces sp. Qhu-G9]|nr:hypothetical protein [Streptomyces aurantiacus]WAU78531.1 hypothetical protein O1Q96_01510 [Streptomyces aurantiacus]